MNDPPQNENIVQKLKLLHQENKSSLSFNKLRVILAIERIVKRLESNPMLSKHLVFKGGFVLLKCYGSTRFTRDLDALGVNISKQDIKALIPKALESNFQDGLWFGDIRCKDLLDQGDYGGYRFDVAFQIGETPKINKIKKLSRVHVDIGFGDHVDQIKTTLLQPLLENNDELTWSVYPLEFIFSEKLQTFVIRGSLNSRAKDIYDMVNLYRNIEDKSSLANAIHSTFATRQTKLPKRFKGLATDIDLSYLNSSWRSVDLMEGKKSFEETWEKFLVILDQVDIMLSKS